MKKYADIEWCQKAGIDYAVVMSYGSTIIILLKKSWLP